MLKLIVAAMLIAVVLSGCVSRRTHRRQLAELKAAQDTLAACSRKNDQTMQMLYGLQSDYGALADKYNGLRSFYSNSLNEQRRANPLRK